MLGNTDAAWMMENVRVCTVSDLARIFLEETPAKKP